MSEPSFVMGCMPAWALPYLPTQPAGTFSPLYFGPGLRTSGLGWTQVAGSGEPRNRGAEPRAVGGAGQPQEVGYSFGA